MKTPLAAILLLAPLALAAPEEAPAEKEAAAEPRGHVFAWPFMDWEQMKPRGGSTRGSDVTLVEEARPQWQTLQDASGSRAKDRAAILAMAGSYRVSFDFVETLGFAADYKPPRPYFSWGTEHVEVLEERDDFISLQHTLVMYFEKDDGTVEGPMVMKHWRQDWSFEPESIWTFQGNLRWEKQAAPEPAGRWSQAVFQVDDSPRYEVMGRWTHEGGLSTWRSDNAPRPLPRREFSMRDDYNILEGVHEITIAPTGWLHTQHNRKLEREDDGTLRYHGLEIGVNRYQAITEPELASAFEASWKKSGPYWAEVRATWDRVLRERESFVLKPSVDERKLWQHHFAHAGKLEAAEQPDHDNDASHARETIESFLAAEESAKGKAKY